MVQCFDSASEGQDGRPDLFLGGVPGPALPGEAVPACAPPRGAPAEVAQAIQANEAAMREVLQLRNISLASSGVGGAGEGDVDPDYICPICLVRAHGKIGLSFRVNSLGLGFRAGRWGGATPDSTASALPGGGALSRSPCCASSALWKGSCWLCLACRGESGGTKQLLGGLRGRTRRASHRVQAAAPLQADGLEGVEATFCSD